MDRDDASALAKATDARADANESETLTWHGVGHLLRSASSLPIRTFTTTSYSETTLTRTSLSGSSISARARMP